MKFIISAWLGSLPLVFFPLLHRCTLTAGSIGECVPKALMTTIFFPGFTALFLMGVVVIFRPPPP